MENRFYKLNTLIYNAYENNDLVKTKTLLLEYQNLAAQNKQNWNYGNAVHVSNIFLGLIALDENDIYKAKQCLINACMVKGSPQLKSFGPNMRLAKALLEKGEVAIVLRYLEGCKKFWNFFLRVYFSRNWKKKIKNNQIPDFGWHLNYHLGINPSL